MSEQAETKKLTGDPRIDFGWFSRRHETREAHKTAKERHQKFQQDKVQLAKVNRIARQQRTAMQQLALLDQRLGVGVGARKERARLQKFIDNHPSVKFAKLIAKMP